METTTNHETQPKYLRISVNEDERFMLSCILHEHLRTNKGTDQEARELKLFCRQLLQELQIILKR